MKIFRLFVAFTLICFALSPTTHAVVPAPDGGYPGGNTAEGQNALQNITSGGFNSAVGFFSLFANSTGSFNTALGAGALDLNTASNNTAIGAAALLLNTTGTSNTATGVDALALNDTGINNTANGAFALLSNTTGHENTAIGVDALRGNTTGSENTAVGHGALTNNIDGHGNTVEGLFALHDNTAGIENTAIGQQALAVNQASNNTATGFQALFSNDSGGGNTACGHQALMTNTTGADNTAVGTNALLNDTGSGNIALGSGAGSDHASDFNNIDIGNIGHAGESGVIRIGTGGTQIATAIAGIFGVGFGTDPVFVQSNGQLGVGVSSARFKTEIKPMDKVSEAILALKPVTFRYKQEMDPRAMLRFGLVAEEVAEVNPDLVGRDAKGQVQTVHYEAVNAMLLNEFLKEHRTVQDLKSTAAKQEATIAQQQKKFEAKIAHQQQQIEALTAGLQKVSDQLELSKPAPRTVGNNQ